MQFDYKNVPETENIQDSSGRLIGGYAGVVGHDSKEEVLKCNENLVHFEATTSISWLQNYASQLQPDYENAPETSRMEDGSGRLVRGFAGVVGHDSKEEVLKCNENLVHFEATTSISWLQNYASQLQPDYENAPETSRMEDGSGRLVGVHTPPVRRSGRVGMSGRTLGH